MVLVVTQWMPLRPTADRFDGCFVWALAPFLVCLGAVLLFASFPLAKRKSGWGICGSSLFVWLWFSLVCFYRSADLKDLCPCTMFLLLTLM